MASSSSRADISRSTARRGTERPSRSTCRDPKRRRDRQPRRAGRPPKEGGKRTRVVEDDPLVRVYVTARLENLGYRTLAAGNAAEAIAVAESGAEFDLLFTDVVMSGSLNGRQLADEMAIRRPGIKVLFTSGYTENAIVHHGRLDA